MYIYIYIYLLINMYIYIISHAKRRRDKICFSLLSPLYCRRERLTPLLLFFGNCITLCTLKRVYIYIYIYIVYISILSCIYELICSVYTKLYIYNIYVYILTIKYIFIRIYRNISNIHYDTYYTYIQTLIYIYIYIYAYTYIFIYIYTTLFI